MWAEIKLTLRSNKLFIVKKILVITQELGNKKNV